MSDQHRPVLIHPGFHKTGTTFLQRKVFTDQSVFRTLWRHDEVDRFVIRAHELDFDPNVGRESLAALRSTTAPKVIDVVSSETLCGAPFFGSRESAERARRMRSIFGDAKILITVRKQSSILRAVFLQYLRQGGTLAPEAFFDQKPPNDYFRFDGRVFEYHKLVEFYAGLFGPENVLVLTQETLRRDADGFVRALCVFCGREPAQMGTFSEPETGENVSPEASAIPLLRLASRFRGGPVNPEMRSSLALVGWLLQRVANRQTWFFRSQAARLDAVIAQRFAGRFAQSNARLQKFAPSDLRAQGYEMPTEADAAKYEP